MMLPLVGQVESTLKYPYYKKENRRAGRNQGHQVENKEWRSNDPKADKAVDDTKEDKVVGDAKMVSSTEKAEDKPCSSEARPKEGTLISPVSSLRRYCVFLFVKLKMILIYTLPCEVSEAVPVQNQAAAQKLLQKMNQSTQGDRNFRGHKHRFIGKQEEIQVFTLEEWERRKGNNLKTAMASYTISRDEELAWQLQNQLDLDDRHVSFFSTPIVPQNHIEHFKTVSVCISLHQY